MKIILSVMIILTIITLVSCSKTSDGTNTTPPITDTTKKDTTKKDTTTKPPTDTTTKKDSIITRVVALTGALNLTDTAFKRGAFEASNILGQGVSLDMSKGNNIRIKFYSADHNPTIIKQSDQDYLVYYHDTCKVSDITKVNLSDTSKYAGWAVEGVDRTKYKCDRIRIILTDDRVTYEGGSILLRVGDIGKNQVIDDSYIRKTMDARAFGVSIIEFQ